MSTLPIATSLGSYESAIDDLRLAVHTLEERLARFENADRSQPARPATVATVSMTPASPSTPPTKGRKKAKATSAPPKATPAEGVPKASAKGKSSTKKAPAIPSNPLPLHLAQTFPQEGKPDRHLVTVVIPDATAAHVVGQGGKGLKQISDISGARVSAYTLAQGGSRDERHVSIRGTDEQIGDALVVLGKRIARKRIHTPKPKKKTEPTGGELQAALDDARSSAPRVSYNRPSAPFLAPPLQSSASLRPIPLRSVPSIPVSRTHSGWGEPDEPPVVPSVQMASPPELPTPTAYAPTVAMGSPSPSGNATPSSPMQIGVIGATSGSAASSGSATPRRQTARRGGGPPRGS